MATRTYYCPTHVWRSVYAYGSPWRQAKRRCHVASGKQRHGARPQAYMGWYTHARSCGHTGCELHAPLTVRHIWIYGILKCARHGSHNKCQTHSTCHMTAKLCVSA